MKNYYYYTAGAIENNSKREKEDWKTELLKYLSFKNVIPYNPVQQESIKTQKTSTNTCRYISGLKRAGQYDRFDQQMNYIWWGDINPRGNKWALLETVRQRAVLNEVTPEEFLNLGDFPAVAASDFVVAYIEKDVKTVGTYSEITEAYFLDIPVFLILSGESKSDANSTLLMLVRQSGGEIFYSVKDCASHIVSKYNLGEE